MAIKLKPVDVAVVGLGAAGGVAVLPLARAGLKVAGIEAGTFMDPHSFKPDEIHNNVRGLLASVPNLAETAPRGLLRPPTANPPWKAARGLVDLVLPQETSEIPRML